MPPVKQLGPRVIQKRKQKYKRSRSGCLTCRTRRVKCDQGKPVCTRCADLERECVWATSVHPQSPSPSRPITPPDEVVSHKFSLSPSREPSVASDRTDRHPHVIVAEDRPPELTRGQNGLQACDPLFHSTNGPTSDPGDYSFLDWALTTGADSSYSTEHTERALVSSYSNALIDPNVFQVFLPSAGWGSDASDSLPLAAPSTETSFSTFFTSGSPTSADLFPPIPATTNQHQLAEDLSSSTLVKRRAAARTTTTAEPALIDPAMPILQSLDPLLQAFPSETNRELFHHFLRSTSRIVVAMNGPDRGNNPFVSIAIPFALLDVYSPARDGVRHALLSLTAAHQHHQHREVSASRSEEMLRASNHEKQLAMASMISSVAISKQSDIDILLVTCMILKARDVLLADRTWKTNLDFAIHLVYRQRGPEAIMGDASRNFARQSAIENLTMTDVISTFTTGQEPTLLGGSNSWWFDCEKKCVSTKEHEAFEYQFGISRDTVEILARARQLTYYKERLAIDDPAPAVRAAFTTIKSQAWSMIEELKIWSVSQMFLPKRARVLSGNSAYRYTVSIMLLTEVIGMASSDNRVQTAVRAVLEICAEISLQPVMLLWPLLYAGANAIAAEDRCWVKGLFETFALNHCYDLMAAECLLQEQWERMDKGQAFTPWHRLMEEKNCQVLLI